MFYINLFNLLLLLNMFLTMIFLNNLFMMNLKILIMFNETFFNLNKNFMFVFDLYTLSFSMTISLVVFNVLKFMNVYMMKSLNIKTFFFMTKLFIFSMFLLVYSFNLWTMIIGWEGLGMTSFYLIFYYNNYESWKSAIKTFINNKIGDSMILVSMIYIILYKNEMLMVMFFFLMSLMTKSAQYPFMAWLPMAMSAPTPISAMVHSSTLVTAGLFILLRFMDNMLKNINVEIIMNLCLLSMIFSGLKAMTEKDMKKMIALSTLSQISLIFFFMISNMKIMAFIYMCNHALFKSLLFINMGMMMMSNYSNQLMLNLMNSKLNMMYMLSYKMSCFNLMNMSFFSSFFIKEKMMMNMENNLFSNMKFLAFLMNSFFTMNYSLKMIFIFNKMNFKMKSNSMFKKNNNIAFFLMNISSLFFSKIFMCMYLSLNTINLYIMLTYLISMILNFKMYKNNSNFINSMVYLNYMIYMYPFNMMKYSLEVNELWMEKLSLNFYFLMKNKMLNKSFNMNFNMILMLIMMLLFM